jgi:hypothetical protein
MNHQSCHSSDIQKDLFEIFNRLGNQIGLPFSRGIFYDDGRREIEFQAQNPVDCIVLELNSWEAVLDLLKRNSAINKKFGCAVLRKKCIKCLLHERNADSVDN